MIFLAGTSTGRGEAGGFTVRHENFAAWEVASVVKP